MQVKLMSQVTLCKPCDRTQHILADLLVANEALVSNIESEVQGHRGIWGWLSIEVAVQVTPGLVVYQKQGCAAYSHTKCLCRDPMYYAV
jgi:hypothetical protein